jgi:tetratricopeptide (TPR) repeat protein
VNILLHGINAVLLWRLLVRLEIPGAWLAAAIFALHPVQVESVAWVTELKNVQMGFFFLLSLLAWTEFTRIRAGRGWSFYALSLIFYALALLSKTTACTLPVALLLIMWLRGERIGWRRLFEVIPYLVLGVGMGLLTVFWERYHQGTQGKLFTMGLVERVLIAARGVWFYLAKLFWPAKLTFSYPRWTLSTADPLAYGWLLALCALGWAAWFAKRYIGRGPCVALVFFVVTLGPVLGFFMLYTFVYTFVADHYQYLACIGPIALVSAGIERLHEQSRQRHPLLVPGLCAILLGMLGLLTWRQSETYRDADTLWHTTIARNPGSWLAHNNLGLVPLAEGQPEEAAAEFREALRINPADPEVINNLGLALLHEGRIEDAVADFHEALRIDPTLARTYYNLGNALLQRGNTQEAVAQYREALRIDPTDAKTHFNLAAALLKAGQPAESIAQLQKALDLQPANLVFENTLAWMLAAAPQTSLRDGPRAVQLATQASHSSGGDSPVILRTLAAAYAQAGQFPDAVSTAQRALQLAQAQSNAVLLNALPREIKLYAAGRSFEEAH